MELVLVAASLKKQRNMAGYRHRVSDWALDKELLSWNSLYFWFCNVLTSHVVGLV